MKGLLAGTVRIYINQQLKSNYKLITIVRGGNSGRQSITSFILALIKSVISRLELKIIGIQLLDVTFADELLLFNPVDKNHECTRITVKRIV